MHQLLTGLEHCHDRHILHRDLKGSDLLINREGVLKIADFGLGSFFDPNRKQRMTSQVVTLRYRPPELLLGATDYSVGVDLWSVGCILAELLSGKPAMAGRTEFFTTEPYAYNPASLPKHPSRKEIEELHNEEARRLQTAAKANTGGRRGLQGHWSQLLYCKRNSISVKVLLEQTSICKFEHLEHFQPR